MNKSKLKNFLQSFSENEIEVRYRNGDIRIVKGDQLFDKSGNVGLSLSDFTDDLLYIGYIRVLDIVEVTWKRPEEKTHTIAIDGIEKQISDKSFTAIKEIFDNAK